MDKLEWIIVPVVNVDGYIYTHTTVSKTSRVQCLTLGTLGQALGGWAIVNWTPDREVWARDLVEALH